MRKNCVKNILIKILPVLFGFLKEILYFLAPSIFLLTNEKEFVDKMKN